MPARAPTPIDAPGQDVLSAALRPGRADTALWQRWLAPALAALIAAGSLLGCGGGSEADAGTASASRAEAAQVTEGTLNGFGSIIVNGLRFDDAQATVTDDAGQLRTSSALKLGMRVTVDSGKSDGSGNARASAVRFGSELLGPVASINVAASSLVLLGQTVEVTSSTVFDEALAAGLGAVAVGGVLEVHGLLDQATGRLVATRIERAASTTRQYKLRGVVGALDSAAKTLRIGAAVVSYASLSSLPVTLVEGQWLRITLATSPVDGVWQAIGLASAAKGRLPDFTQVHLRGKISAFTSAQSFTVAGMAVDASGASFPDDTSGLGLGTEVEVQGTVSNGLLVATQVSLESRHKGEDSRRFDLRGVIASVDSPAKTLVVKGVTVSWAGNVVYENGSEARLLAGARVRVTGGLGSSRSQVLASRVRFED